MNLLRRKTRLFKIGHFVAVDPSQITALYVQDGLLIIRQGIGIIRLAPHELFGNLGDTFEFLCKMRNVR